MSTMSTNRISTFNYDEFKVKNKRDYHEAMDRSGFCMPPLKSSGMTIAYMDGVHNKDFWCPMYSELQLRSCYNPPKKEEIFKAVDDYLDKNSTKGFGLSDASKVDV